VTITEETAGEGVVPREEAERIRAMLLRTAISQGKARLAAAKAAADRKDSVIGPASGLTSLEAKRALFERLRMQYPTLTLAARQGEALSEADLDSLLADFAELGAIDKPTKE
jgi:hypothetical protein